MALKRKLTKSEQSLVKLAAKNGSDADLLLLREIEAVEERVSGVDTSVKKVAEDLKKIQLIKGDKGDSIKGEKGETGERGLQGLAGKDGRNGTNGKDGRNGRDGKDGTNGRNGIDGKNGVDGKDGAMGVIDEATIGYIENEIATVKTRVQQIEIRPLRAGAKGVGLYINGSKKLLTAQTLNLIAGTGMTISYDFANGRNDIIFTASGGGGGGILTATGTVDGVNADFTFDSEPSVIIVDGGRAMQKVSSDGTINWTGTTLITLAVAPNFDIYGLS